MSKIRITIFTMIIFFLIEFTSQSIVLLFGERKYSLIIFKPISNQISKITTNYEISWDYKNNKMKPGKYLNEKESLIILIPKVLEGKNSKLLKIKKE